MSYGNTIRNKTKSRLRSLGDSKKLKLEAQAQATIDRQCDAHREGALTKT
jgi:hypothetical protein